MSFHKISIHLHIYGCAYILSLLIIKHTFRFHCMVAQIYRCEVKYNTPTIPMLIYVHIYLFCNILHYHPLHQEQYFVIPVLWFYRNWHKQMFPGLSKCSQQKAVFSVLAKYINRTLGVHWEYIKISVADTPTSPTQRIIIIKPSRQTSWFLSISLRETWKKLHFEQQQQKWIKNEKWCPYN